MESTKVYKKSSNQCVMLLIYMHTQKMYLDFFPLSLFSVTYHKKKSLNFFTLPINLFN